MHLIVIIAIILVFMFFKKTKKEESSDFEKSLFDFMARYEGKNKTGYIDSSGKWHTGLGHLILKGEENLRTKVLTEAQIFDLFQNDLKKRNSDFEFAKKVFKEKIGRKMTEREMVAYYSFMYNLGYGNLKALFSGNYLNFLKNNKAEAKRTYEKYSNVNGKPNATIKKRRTEEFEFMY